MYLKTEEEKKMIIGSKLPKEKCQNLLGKAAESNRKFLQNKVLIQVRTMSLSVKSLKSIRRKILRKALERYSHSLKNLETNC